MGKKIKRIDVDGTEYYIDEEDTVDNVKIDKPKGYVSPDRLFSKVDYSKNKPLTRKELQNLADKMAERLVKLGIDDQRMIIYKPKSYVTDLKDSKLTQESPKRFTPVCWDVWECAIDITYSSLYSKEMEKSGMVIKKIIRSLIKDIKNGYLYTDGPTNKDSDTHIINELSDKHNLVWNKRINTGKEEKS